MLAYEIQAFGQRLGLDALALDHNGIAQLNIDGLGSLFLELADGNGRRELLIYLAAQLHEHDDAAPRRLLEACDFRNAHPFPLSAGVFSGRGIVLTRIEERQVTASVIENALRFLTDALHA